MIREPAARKLAHDLFDVYLARGLISEKSIDDVVKIIIGAVEIDERQQAIERKESVIRAIGGRV